MITLATHCLPRPVGMMYYQPDGPLVSKDMEANKACNVVHASPVTDDLSDTTSGWSPRRFVEQFTHVVQLPVMELIFLALTSSHPH
jgi:hypothetical protein